MIELASPIKWLIDVLKGFDERRISNKEERFRLFFEKTYLDLLKIHRNYVEMLRQCENDLPAFLSLSGEPHQWYSGKDAGLLTKQEIPGQIEKVKRHWQTAREETGGERVQLRAMSSELIKTLEDAVERRYIFSLINYFIHPERMYIDAGHIDMKVESLLDRGPDAILDSPSLTVWEKIKNENDADKIRQVFDTTRVNILARWSEVSERYAELYTTHVATKA